MLVIVAVVAVGGALLLVAGVGARGRAGAALVGVAGFVAGVSVMGVVAGSSSLISTSNRVTYMDAVVQQVNDSGTSVCLAPSESDEAEEPVCADVPDRFRGDLLVGTEAMFGLADVRPPEGAVDSGSRMIVYVAHG